MRWWNDPAHGALALRRPDLGTLEAGQVADILVLSEDPRESAAAFRALDAVIHKGVWMGRGGVTTSSSTTTP